MTVQSPTGATPRRTMAPLAAFLLVLVIVLIAGLGGTTRAADKHRKLINCNLHEGPCTQVLAGSTVSLAVLPRPVKAMADLVFRVTLAEDSDLESDPYIDLDMPGMTMGKNQVVLKAVKPGAYEGTGVIVRCKSGRRTWRATVTLPGSGSTEFVFDVIY